MGKYKEVVKCDQCVACMINGIFCHEQGCPNSDKEYINGERVEDFEAVFAMKNMNGVRVTGASFTKSAAIRRSPSGSGTFSPTFPGLGPSRWQGPGSLPGTNTTAWAS